ncbi:sulfotransferase family protein [Rhizorhabdus sp. FW153]|uniref:sulfotransferase family protein n=1 Tax=Rhizorhabdus sp. FW153 TaxID=3400216 RepID=UPI003CF7BFE4
MASAPLPPPTLLVAPAFSGTRALRHILSAHPAINIAPELDVLVDAITPDGRFMKRDAFLRSVEYDVRFKRLGLAIPTGENFAGIARSLYEQIAAARPDASVHGFTLEQDFDRILWLWPDARFIHLVRDGRDVAVGNVRAHRAGDLWHGIADWAASEALWDRMSHKLPADRQFALRFEMLVNEPDYELQRLCAFLGLPMVPAIFQQAPVLLQEAQGLWRKADTKEVSAAEHRAARWLLQNSYFLSGTVRPPSIIRRTLLNLSNRLAVTNHRRRLLGTGLWLKSKIVGKLGTRKAKARIRRRQFDIMSRQPD